MDHYEIMCKLIGPIAPVGESTADARRLDNLINFMLLTQKMVLAVKEVSKNSVSYEASVKQAGNYAANCLLNIKEDLE